MIKSSIARSAGAAHRFHPAEDLFDGLADAPVNLVVAVGRNDDPDRFGPPPPNVRIERYIPQTLLFSRCDLVICHAGSGTIMAALSHGLPLVLMPIGDEGQPERGASTGVLRLVGADEDALTPPTARAAVLEALDDPSYRSKARDLRVEIEALPGPERAVTLLEQLVA